MASSVSVMISPPRQAALGVSARPGSTVSQTVPSSAPAPGLVGEQIEPRGTTRDSMARETCPDLHRWEWMSFVGIVSHVLGGTFNPQVVGSSPTGPTAFRSEEHTSELQSRPHLGCR